MDSIGIVLFLASLLALPIALILLIKAYVRGDKNAKQFAAKMIIGAGIGFLLSAALCSKYL